MSQTILLVSMLIRATLVPSYLHSHKVTMVGSGWCPHELGLVEVAQP